MHIRKPLRLTAAILAGLLLVGSLAACDLITPSGPVSADGTAAEATTDTEAATEPTTETAETTAETTDETEASTGTGSKPVVPSEDDSLSPPEDQTGPGNDSPATRPTTPPVIDPDEALGSLDRVDFNGDTLSILCDSQLSDEISGGAASDSQSPVSTAVYERDRALEKACNLKLARVTKENVLSAVRNEVSSSNGDFALIDAPMGTTATSIATAGMLCELSSAGVHSEEPWWDKGTSEFRLRGRLYFLSCAANVTANDVTFALLFNKDMLEEERLADPYKTVRAGKWTLPYFYDIIQNISRDDNADGNWDERDTYGFIATWEYGNYFFAGADLSYVISDSSVDEPVLRLEDETAMAKAVDTVDQIIAIFHQNNSTYRVPPGRENNGLTAFRENRALFNSEIIACLRTLNTEGSGHYGLLPLPKYDGAQESYISLFHEVGSTLSMVTSVSNGDKIYYAAVLDTLAILSEQYITPAYEKATLTSHGLYDQDSADMLRLILANRAFDMGMVYNLGFVDIAKSCVNEGNNIFLTRYKAPATRFDRAVRSLLSELN